MPYASVKDLPQPVQEHLPHHGQEIYLKVFNNAWEEYKDPHKRRAPGESHEGMAHKVAWAAVKKVYMKKGDKWVASSLSL